MSSQLRSIERAIKRNPEPRKTALKNMKDVMSLNVFYKPAAEVKEN